MADGRIPSGEKKGVIFQGKSIASFAKERVLRTKPTGQAVHDTKLIERV